MVWYLIDTDAGIIDQAEKKAILMWRYGFSRASRAGKAYMVQKSNFDGIGGNFWIIKETDLADTGFSWVLDDRGE